MTMNRGDMREITITQYNFEPDIKTFVGQIMAVINLDETGVQHVAGSDHYLRIPVSDPATGEQITAEQEPMRWAQLLPETLGYGDIEVALRDVAVPAAEPRSIEPDVTATEALAALVH
jgi:hypothetical protein